MSKEIFDKLRGMVRRVSVKSIDDTGEMQTATVEVADGIERKNVEVWQPYGLVGVPDTDGAISVAIAIGGDEGDLWVLPPSNPSQRMGGLNKGDVGIANKSGDRVIVGADGKIQVKAAVELNVSVGGVSFKVDAAGVHITGGGIWHDGVPIDKTHRHGAVMRGAEETDPPVG